MSEYFENLFKDYRKKDEFSLWFVKNMNSGKFHVFEGDDEVECLSADEIVSRKNDDRIYQEFTSFLSRPEKVVGELVSSEMIEDLDCMKFAYDRLIYGISFLRAAKAGKNDEAAIKQADRLIKWLESGDFYTAPASTRFHEAHKGGLIKHSLRVYNKICEMSTLPSFKGVDISSAALIALTHDFCKIGCYIPYDKNVKNEKTGVWEKEKSYKFNEDGSPFPLGHGVASMFILSRFFSLNLEESLAIRWHMSDYRCCSQDESELQDACERYPLVRMIQFADQLACTNYC